MRESIFIGKDSSAWISNLRVTLVVPGALPRSEEGKLKRTMDLREL